MNVNSEMLSPADLRDSLRSHIESEFAHLSRFAGHIEPDLCEPLASCIQEYYEQIHDTHALEDPVLTLLLARTLWNVGEEDLSRAYLDHARSISAANHFESLVQSRAQITPSIAHWVSLQVLRSCSFVSGGNEAQWMLDLSRLHDDRSSVFELTRNLLLRTFLQQIAPVFDPDQGRGVLWIRRYSHRPSRREDRGVISGWPSEELLGWADYVLSSIQVKRGWTACPSLHLVEFSS